MGTDRPKDIPYGECWCGCGQKTTISPQTVRTHGYVKGEPRRYVIGHSGNHNGAWRGEGPNPSGLCMCGCGERTEIANRTLRSRGYVKGKPRRFIHGHRARLQRAAENWIVDEDTGCWIWQGSTAKGYGVVGFQGRQTYAHRWQYILRYGEIPAGYHVHHDCEKPLCVNPDHLRPITPEDHARLHHGPSLSERQPKTAPEAENQAA